MDIPAFETARLRLRAHRMDDFPRCSAVWADPVVTRFIGGRPFTAEEVWARLLRYAGHWQWLGYGFWAVEEKATGLLIGEAGFADFHREMEPPVGDSPEAGWVLTPEAHGKGYATEAMRGALEWSVPRFGSRGTVCLIDPGNAASVAVARKCGYREARRVLYKGSPTIVLARAAIGA